MKADVEDMLPSLSGFGAATVWNEPKGSGKFDTYPDEVL